MRRSPSSGVVLLAAIAAIASIIAWRAWNYASELERAFRGGDVAAWQAQLADLESRNRILEDLVDTQEAELNHFRGITPRADSRISADDRYGEPALRQRTGRRPPLRACDCAHCRYTAARAERLESLR